ncbi:DUF6162 family protein [Vibrio cidicii]|uniref:DUF6162 family protein n=1 Tax=Vibrio cidicii TaxID=1763883 RepID=UPI003F510721
MALSFELEKPQSSAISVPVRANRGDQETRWVVAAIALILLCAWLSLRIFYPAEQALSLDAPTWQLPSEALNDKQKSVVTELSLADYELRDYWQSHGQLPDVAWLAEQGIAPFATDASWQFLGAHQWQRLTQGYLGQSTRAQGTGHVLLWYDEDQQVQIWFLPDDSAPNRADFATHAPQQWILTGWKRWSPQPHVH